MGRHEGRYDRDIEFFRNDTKSHKATLIGPGHWLLKTPKSSNLWAEVVVHSGSRALTVWGDIDVCTFAYYDGSGGPEGIINWVASMTGSYLAEKASIGTGHIGVFEYKQSKALEDLNSLIEDAEEQEKNEEDEFDLDADYYKTHEKESDTLKSFLDRLEDDSWKPDFCDEIRDGWEVVGDIGMVLTLRVIYAREMVRKLRKLIEANAVENSDYVFKKPD